MHSLGISRPLNTTPDLLVAGRAFVMSEVAMTLTIRLLGLELLHLSIETDSTDTAAESGPGDCTSTAMGFGFNDYTRWDADGVE